jgi:hypothetical protein
MEACLDARDACRRISELSLRPDTSAARDEAMRIIYGISSRVAARLVLTLKSGEERRRCRQPKRDPATINPWDGDAA